MIIAIDVGGTKTLITAFTDNGAIGRVKRIATAHDPKLFMEDIVRLVGELKPQPSDTITIAAPGLIEDGTIISSPNLGFKNMKLKDLLVQTFHTTVTLENDAHIAALGATYALPEIPPLVLYITIGTGIGSGIILNGQLEPAFARSEAGHMVFQTEAGLATWESLAAGRVITATYGKLAADITDSAAWREITKHLAIGFRVLIPALQPDVILIGGGVGASFERFHQLLNEELRKELPAFITIPPIQQAQNPEYAVLYGCYHYAKNFSTVTSKPH